MQTRSHNKAELAHGSTGSLTPETERPTETNDIKVLSGYTVTGVTTCVAATSEHEDNAFKWTQSDTTLTAAKCVEVTRDASARLQAAGIW